MDPLTKKKGTIALKRIENEKKRAELIAAAKKKKKDEMSPADKKLANDKKYAKKKKKREDDKDEAKLDVARSATAKKETKRRKVLKKKEDNEARMEALGAFVAAIKKVPEKVSEEESAQVVDARANLTYLQDREQYRFIPRNLFTEELEILLKQGHKDGFAESSDEDVLTISKALVAMVYAVSDIILKRQTRSEEVKLNTEKKKDLKETNLLQWTTIVGKKRRRAVARAKALYRSAERSTTRMMRDTHYKISHYMCRNFVHNAIPNFSASEIAQLTLAAWVKRRLNILSFGKFYQRMEDTNEQYAGDGTVLRGDESFTTMTCGGCFRHNEFVGSNPVFTCNYEDCPLYQKPVPRDGNAARNIFMKMHLNVQFPPTHECYQRNEYINDVYVR